MEDAGDESVGAGSWEKWTAASVIQLGTGIYSYRKVRSGECRLMPLKAFGIASLFVGAGFTSLFALVTANGIHSVNDFVKVGANIRSSLGARPRTQNERS
ncbi:hypothetical protein DCAR_0728770 [Daucus carota subsp. sativus]|uniref:Uncharacterized protein n=1 Tax=Daucus carota subsp. sativus TaxID=79200 RepID=A0AAF0XLQ2_DAUCS|nr:PREDICTED: uncharacterized protein LOC108193531 [Daucus carota subsp. sativus]XP_017215721.1 PREDICTED: uncharacterized protein LOC108193531 [Daucus carota subsp. sativus]WOH09314.1 hypothetical protein DCAR_0728770 [Daucus carota subsp. sativus]